MRFESASLNFSHFIIFGLITLWDSLASIGVCWLCSTSPGDLEPRVFGDGESRSGDDASAF